MKNKYSKTKSIGTRQRRIIYLCLVLFALIAASAFSYFGEVNAENKSGSDYDEVSVDPTGEGEGYAAVLYDSTNGLPTSEANAITETDDGFIWIGSYSGLIRCDGTQFYRYDSTTGITSVVSLYVDSKQRLWIGTNDNGVLVMDKGEITQIPLEGVKSLSIRSIAEDPNGNIIIATTHGMGYIDSELVSHTIDASQINEESIKEIREGADGRIYGITLDGALFVMKDFKVEKFYDGESVGVGVINTVLPDSDNPGYVYLGTDEAEIYHGTIDDDLSEMDVTYVNPLDNINSIENFGGTLWICADNGIGLIANDRFIKVKNVPMDNSVDEVIADYQGNLWFASSRQGVMKVVVNRFTDISERKNLDDVVVNTTCKLDNTLLLGTDKGLISASDSALKVKLDITDNQIKVSGDLEAAVKEAANMIELMDGIRIRSIIKDSEGKLWFSTYSELGLVVYDKGRVYNFNTDSGLPSHRVRVVSESSDGSIVVATSGGIAVIKDDEIVNVYDGDNGITNTEILTVVEDDNGKIYAGSDGDGIYVIDGNNVSNITADDGLSSEVILRLKKDSERDIIWIITSNSIAYLKNGKITTIENFPYSNNFDMYEDNDGHMWILSSNGIYVISIDDLIANKESFDYTYFDHECGLPCVATANSYSYLNDYGILYVAGSSGVFSVNINKDFSDISNIKMAIPYADVDGELIYANEDGEIIVPPTASRITIYGYVFNYSLNDPKVTYFLDGFDSEATTISRRNLEPVSYTNLPGGTYEFDLSISNTQTEEVITESVTIVKQMAIYERTWFKVLIVSLAFIMVGWIVALSFRKRTRELEKKTAENKIFIREMIEAFAKVIDAKDEYTNGHSTRVAEYTKILAEEMGFTPDQVDDYYNIALLHDIGKVSIPIDILNKPGKLTDQEFNIIKSHSAQGYKILKDISIMPDLAIGAGYHHERPDGKGYPKGVTADEIPEVARIIAVADTFDAMYSNRPYRKRMNFEKVVSIIKEVSGTQLDPTVVDAFLRLVDKGEFRDPDDDGGGSTETIDNIHKKFSDK